MQQSSVDAFTRTFAVSLVIYLPMIVACAPNSVSRTTQDGNSIESETRVQNLEEAIEANSLQVFVSASQETWDESAICAGQFLENEIAKGRLSQAQDFTGQVLKFPRHPDRNDPYGWRHATICLDRLISGLVENEKWEMLVEV